MPMGANAWRLGLAKKEAEERNKFGWRDIMDLLTTGFSAYQGIEGIKQGRAAQDLNERRQGVAEQTLGMETAAAGKTGTWGKLDDAYQGPPAASQSEVGGPLGRWQFDQTGTAEDAALRKERLEMLREGWGPDIQGPLPEQYQRGEGYMRNPMADVESQQKFLEAHPPQYDANNPFTLTDRGYVPTPGYGDDVQRQHELKLAGIRSAGSGGGGIDPTDVRLAYKDLRGYAENDVMNAHPEAWVDGINGRDFGWTPDLQSEVDARMQAYKADPTFANLFPNAQTQEGAGELSFGAALGEMAIGLMNNDPEALSDYEELKVNDPASAALVDMIRAQAGQMQANSGGSGIGGLFDTVNKGIDTYRNIRALPGEVAALPGKVRTGVEDANEAAWPLRTIWDLLR